jgi:hypothetical protein
VLKSRGEVVHVDGRGQSQEPISPATLATALIGKLAIRYPLASAFVPKAERAKVCPGCGGTGVVAELPEQLRTGVACQCGGIGWFRSKEIRPRSSKQKKHHPPPTRSKRAIDAALDHVELGVRRTP